VLRVGLTGGIASGKSTVARRLVDLGAVVVDSDALARVVVAPGSEGLAEVVEAFGTEVLDADGALDRPALGRLVFADPSARTRLEDITHPRIAALTRQHVAAAPQDAVVVHDVPLLVEKGWSDRYHLVVVVHADAEDRVRRLVEDRGSDEADARARISAQADDAARWAAADVWLDNTGARQELVDAVDVLWRDRLVPFEENVRERRHVPAPSDVVLREPDPGWAAAGDRLAARVRRAAGDSAVAVDHVGSTAVPGLAAKDVIDLQLVVEDLDVADALAPVLGDAGFPVWPGEWSDGAKDGVAGPGDQAVWRKRLHGSADPGRPVHLHVRTAGSPGAGYALLFRDWLRVDDESRREYEQEKRRVAAAHRARADYAEAKEPWFSTVAWPRMQRWAAATGWSSPV
jgi:dephospho-CoA kinase